MDARRSDGTAVQRVGWPRLPVLAAAVALATSSVAGATTATGTFTVQATIASACLVSATLLNFGTYSPSAGAALTGNSTISVNCTSGTPYTTTLNIGSGGGTFTTRTLLSGANTLNFNLYKDAAFTQVWGDGSTSTFTVTGTGSGLLVSNNTTVYGQIPISQDKPTGVYTSLITVTVTY
jgi:spore coat protein U-like protein